MHYEKTFDVCSIPGPPNCDSDGYWTCDSVAYVYATSMGTTGWADCSTTIPSGSTSTWAETTFVARAYSRARAPGTDSATCSLTPRSQENAGIHLLRWGGLRLRRGPQRHLRGPGAVFWQRLVASRGLL